MLQRAKTWDFTTRFLIKQRNINNRHKPGTPSHRKDMTHLGVWTRERLVDLGPTFIKLGQLASTRRDIYSSEFIQELQTLQDQVPPIPEDDVVDILNREVPNMFSYIEKTPFKSASLGQVHKATLNTGVPVVIKVQRPNIKDIVDRDIQNILDVLTFLEFLGVNTGTGSKKIFEEAVVYLYNELDYEIEALNAITFYNNFRNTGWVRIPRVYSKIVKKNILVMECVEGEKITEVKEHNRVKVAKALVTSFVIQIMTHGVFHGDPHPGNVAVNKEGQLVYYDFGLVVTLPEDLRDNISKMLPLVIQKDIRGIVNCLVDMNLIIPTAEKTDIIMFMEAVVNYLEKMDGKAFSMELAQDELASSLAKEKPFQIPSDFIFLGKSFTTIDGICRQLDPNFNFIDYIEPMIEEEITNSINIGEMARTSMEIPTRIKTIDETVRDMELSRVKMKRMLESSQNDLKMTQVAILLAIVMENVTESNVAVGVVLSLLFIFQKTRQ
jgi:predicted unusual protein kinase regulating ubiquinone biosynthesis (AarF/ABC1/UbiB family)